MNPDRWERIKQLYHSALNIEPNRRRAFLMDACAGEEDLIGEVASLLAQGGESAGLFQTPALETIAQALANDQRQTPQEKLAGYALSRYRIHERIGEGGMGVIYRAEDTGLHRQVAIKVLPEGFTNDTERLARLKREAQVLASLNHANIATLHDLEQSGGQRFIVMELVEGQTLASRLLKGPLPLEEALEVCRQIAAGLQAAHEKGIVHRDLKPDNVMISAGNKVKILDFGLAKAQAGQLQQDEARQSSPISHVNTQAGMILGTAAYMSPEQASGKPVDKRADIWAFGCILYECLTARRAFHGDTASETIAAVLRGEPDWAVLPVETPRSVRTALRQCLQKDLARRLHDIADAFVVIDDSAPHPPVISTSVHRFSFWRIALMAAIVASAATVATIALMNRFVARPSALVTRSIIRLQSGQWLAGMGREAEFWRPSRNAMAISGDGRFIVYSAIEANLLPQAVPRLYIRWTDRMEAKPITGTEGGIGPFLSPDNRWLGFWAEGKLQKVPVEGGIPTACDVSDSSFSESFGASWGQNNSVVFSPHMEVGLSIVPADGTKRDDLTSPEAVEEETGHRLPHWLPREKGVLFTIMRETYDVHPRVAVLDLKTRRWKVLLEDAADATYVPTGHLVFLRRGELMAVPFDINRLEISGASVPVVADVLQAINCPYNTYNTCAGQYSISDSGSLIYAPGGIVPDREDSLVWVDQKGSAQSIVPFKASFIGPRLSHDGRRIAYSSTGSRWGMHVFDVARGTASQVTNEGKTGFLTWTGEGRRLIFTWWKSGRPAIYWQPSDASSPMERLDYDPYGRQPGSMSPDGTTLAFVGSTPDTALDILLLDLRSRKVTPFLNSRSSEAYPTFSPDGPWLAYTSDESGQEEVYVRHFPRPDAKWKLSLEGGTEPLWARNGKQLFYRWRDQVWAVDIGTDRGFTPSRPRLLFERAGYRTGRPIANWDVSLDGRRFLMVKADERKAIPVTEIILIQNWFEELKRLCPTK